MELYKIVADSSADVLTLSDIPFASAPLTISTAETHYVDDSTLDVETMVLSLAHYKGRSQTSCPNPSDWLAAFGDAQHIFCLCITATLSGSYNAAVIAKQMYEEMYPGRTVFVINSLSTGPEMRLLIEKIEDCIKKGMEYEAICDAVTAYSNHTHLFFMLESMKNLANNGRINPILAKATGLLGIRIVGRASDVGDLQPLEKCRGQIKALGCMAEQMKKQGLGPHNKVRIDHCLNEEAAHRLREILLQDFPGLDVSINACRGLCSFYAEQGGLLVGFETL